MTAPRSVPAPRQLSDEERALWEKASAAHARNEREKADHPACYGIESLKVRPDVLLSLLTALSSEREAGEEGRALHNIRHGMATPGMYVDVRLQGSGDVALSWWTLADPKDECLADVDGAPSLAAAVAQAMEQIREDTHSPEPTDA